MAMLAAAIPALAAGGTAAAGTAAATAGTASIFTLSNLSAIASIASGAAGFMGAAQAASAAETRAKQIELQGRFDAIKTNDELMRTMSANNVAATASGLASAGSAQYAQEQSMANAAESLSIQRMNTAVRKSEAEQQASAARQGGLFDLVSGGMSAGERIASSLQTKKRTTG